MHTCHLASHVAGVVGPWPYLRLISTRVWHAPNSLAHPLFSGVAHATLVGSSITCGVCCYHPYYYVPIYRVHPTILVPFTARWLSTLLCTYVSVWSCYTLVFFLLKLNLQRAYALRPKCAHFQYVQILNVAKGRIQTLIDGQMLYQAIMVNAPVLTKTIRGLATRMPLCLKTNMKTNYIGTDIDRFNKKLKVSKSWICLVHHFPFAWKCHLSIAQSFSVDWLFFSRWWCSHISLDLSPSLARTRSP